jgi:peptidoglycan/LPS O-acetylase OafA/YrhL
MRRGHELALVKGELPVSYGRFAAMIATSTVVMFVLMYLNTYAISHVEYSQTRMWMAFVMGAAMAIVMIGFMWGMYKNRRTNIGIVLVSVAIFAAALWLTRSQETVDDMSYLKAMIPHHSIAIMTSERAHIRDPKVRLLADRIIDAQVREIAEMKRHIARLETNPVPEGSPDLPSYRDKGVPPPPPETDESAGVDTLKPIR